MYYLTEKDIIYLEGLLYLELENLMQLNCFQNMGLVNLESIIFTLIENLFMLLQKGFHIGDFLQGYSLLE